MASSHVEENKFIEIIEKSILVKDGDPARYHLLKNTNNLDESKPYRKIIFGEREKNKPHKIILMAGETGTGKTKMINTMINYLLGVKREDKVWFEITDDQSDQTSAHSQTTSITVYGFYLQDSPTDVSIIDTPGYGDTRGPQFDKEISVGLLSLCTSEEDIRDLHSVCLVVKATQNRLSDRQVYIFDAVQSLFGKDIAENIVLLFTHSDGMRPKNALTAVKEAKIKCAQNVQGNQPVFFLFNNCQSHPFDEDYEVMQEHFWNLSFKGMMQLFEFLDSIEPKSLMMTQNVLQERERLEASINNLQERVQLLEMKQTQLNQTKEALERNKEDVEKNNNFEYEVDVPHKKLVDIDYNLANVAVCCTICKENCHYPGCWWISGLSWCIVMEKGKCTVCTNKCPYKDHMKGHKIYQSDTRKEKRTFEKLLSEYQDKIKDGRSLVQMLEEEVNELKEGKIKLVYEAFHCVKILQMISLKTDSIVTLLHADFLIEKLKEMREFEKAETLEDMKKKAGRQNQGVFSLLKNYILK